MTEPTDDQHPEMHGIYLPERVGGTAAVVGLAETTVVANVSAAAGGRGQLRPIPVAV